MDTFTLAAAIALMKSNGTGGMEIHICSANEYDSSTRVPTIQSPDEKTIYLVPASDSEAGD